jgi:O-antigen/teichoic acid export membrane protein
VSTDVKLSRRSLYKGVGLTVGAYGIGRFVRLVASITLTRLLTPELFGVITIVNSIRTGIDLISDVGVAQAIVQNQKGEDPAFYNSGWSLKAVRGLVLWAVCAVAAPFVAYFYNSPIFVAVLPVAALYFVFDGFSSISFFIMQKRMKIAELSLLSFVFELIPALSLVILAYFFRSIWSLVFGLLIASAVRMVISHFLLSDVRVTFSFHKQYLWEIVHFGKWIFFSSAIYFFSSNFDRLYLGKMVPLGLLGIYGVARSLSDTIVLLASRLSGLIVFPYISSSSDSPKEQLHGKLASTRLRLLFVTALGLSAFAAIADFPIKIIYDPRYYGAAGILPFTTLGAWFAIICSINEAVLLGYGRPKYAAAGNALKFGWLLVGLPVSYTWHGFFGVILVVAAGDLFRYIPILIGQIRIRFSFGLQDLLMSFVMFGLFAFFVWLRWSLGFGLALSNPIGQM